MNGLQLVCEALHAVADGNTVATLSDTIIGVPTIGSSGGVWSAPLEPNEHFSGYGGLKFWIP